MQDLRAGSPVSAAQPGSPGREGRGPPRPPGGDLTSPGVPKAAGNASGDNLGAGRSLPGPGWAEPTCCSFAQRGLFWKVSAERSPRQRQWRPQIHRKCTDPAWLLLFFLFWTGLVFITGYSVVAGATGRLLFGYDSFGNVCGKRNSPVDGAPFSGQDMTLKSKHVFFMNSCDLDVRKKRPGPTALCVSSCPEEQLNTLEEVQLFANTNGSFLCVYSLNSLNYTQSPDADRLCPRLPVPPSKSFPLFNRCIPQTSQCYSAFASTMINDLDTLHRILSGIMAGRDTVLGLCFLALGDLPAFVVVLTLWFCFLVVCGVLWWLYYDYTNDLSTELDTERENMKCVLGFAIVSSVITVILLILIFVLRKRIKLTVELFQVTHKAIRTTPFLLLQPVWTFAILMFFWVLWVAVLLSLGTAGAARVMENGQVEYEPISGIRYLWWYHLIGLLWTSEFILACQQMTVAGAVVSCYFNRNKNDPPDRPILSSLSVLFCYHQGTVVKGSFFITVTRIPRVVLMCIHNTVKGKHSAWSRDASKCCYCGFWCLGKCLLHLNQSAYTAAAINGTDFCTSAKDALKILSKNSSHFLSVCCFGSSIIFLGKVLAVCLTVFAGLLAFNYSRALQVWGIPLLLVAFFAFFVAHSFLSVFETVLDTLLLCFAVDLDTNDGSSERPYFMDQEFLVSSSPHLTAAFSLEKGAQQI
uniref:Choline transporter-like protein n=1 Tax=Castor canadensis TaxID=51338 RepID=A0A8C0XHH5_CASCN